MSQPMEQCQNCHKMFPESKIPTHFGYCRRNIKKCPKCGEMYDINFEQEHEEQYHQKAKCQFCSRQFPPAQVSKHENSCPKRTQFCEYCEQNVPFSEYPSHLRACEARTRVCEKCRKPIMNKDYLTHLVSCPGYVEEKPKPVVKDYQQYVQNQRDGFNKDKKQSEQIFEDYYSQDPAARNKKPYSYVEEMEKDLKKYEKIKKEQKDDFYSRDRGQKYAPVRPGISNTTKPQPTYKSNANYYREELERKQREEKKGIRNTYNEGNNYGARINQVRKPESKGRNQIGSYKNVPTRVNEPKYPTREEPKVPTRDSQKYGGTRNQNPVSRPQPKYPSSSTSSNQTKPSTYNRQPINPTGSRQPTNTYTNQQTTNPYSRNQDNKKNVPEIDPTLYDFDDHQPSPDLQNLTGLDDAEMRQQMMIWESMKSQKPNKPNQLPKQFQGIDMNESFYHDYDEQKQKKLYEQIQRNNRRR